MSSCAFDGSIDGLCAGRFVARMDAMIKSVTRTDPRGEGFFGEASRRVFEASAMFE